MPPLRPWGDFFFFPGWRGFAIPTSFKRYRDTVISNLLYYQTNYLVVSTAIFVIDGFKEPEALIKGLAVLLGIFRFLVWAGEIQPLVRIKRWSPLAFFYTVLVIYDFLAAMVSYNETFASSYRFSRNGMILHAVFRYRDMSEVEYHREAEELKGSRMGTLLISQEKKNTKTN